MAFMEIQGWVQRGSGSQSTMLLAAGSFEGRLSGSFHSGHKDTAGDHRLMENACIGGIKLYKWKDGEQSEGW